MKLRPLREECEHHGHRRNRDAAAAIDTDLISLHKVTADSIKPNCCQLLLVNQVQTSVSANSPKIIVFSLLFRLFDSLANGCVTKLDYDKETFCHKSKEGKADSSLVK